MDIDLDSDSSSGEGVAATDAHPDSDLSFAAKYAIVEDAELVLAAGTAAGFASDRVIGALGVPGSVALGKNAAREDDSGGESSSDSDDDDLLYSGPAVTSTTATDNDTASSELNALSTESQAQTGKSASKGNGRGRGRGTRQGGVGDEGADEEDEEGGGDMPPVRTKNEVPMWQLPIPSLPVLLAGPHLEVEHAGVLLHVHEGTGWDFDPVLALEGGGRGMGKKGKKNAGGTGIVDSDESACRVYTLIIQSQLPAGSRPLDEGSALVLPDKRVLGFVEDVFGPVKSPLYLLRVHARVSIPNAQLVHAMDSAGLDPGSLLADKSAGGLVGTEGCGKGQSTAFSLLADAYGDDSDGDEGAQVEGTAVLPSAADPSPPAPAAMTLVRVCDLRPGSPLLSVKSMSRFIIPEALMAAFPRGSDASNVHDEEIREEEQEFSDDEAETSAKSRAKALRRRREGEGEHARQEEDGAEEEVQEPDGALLDAPHAMRGGRGRGRGAVNPGFTTRGGRQRQFQSAHPHSQPSPQAAHGQQGQGHANWPPAGAQVGVAPGMPVGYAGYPYPPVPYGYGYPPGHAGFSGAGYAGQHPLAGFAYPYPYSPGPQHNTQNDGSSHSQRAAMAAFQAQLMKQIQK